MKRPDYLRRVLRAACAGAILLAGAAPAVAVMPVNPHQPFFLGVWTIKGSRPAPWQTAAFPSDVAEMRRLTGSRITFAAYRIIATMPLACRNPRYRMRDYATDMLFQGGLTAPRGQAVALGFTGAVVPTLETGCDGALDFHFLTSRTAMFALNNRIYTVTRNGR